MNCIKFHSVLATIKARFQIFILGIIISMFITSCGGGPVPEYLREAKVDVSIWTPKKEVVFQKDGLNLVKVIMPLKNSSELMIASDREVFKLLNYELNPDAEVINHELSQLDILKNKSGEPSYIIGSGLWGKPSAAVLDMSGQLKWKKEYGYNAMGMAAILDDGDERFVVLEKKDQGLLFLNFESGEIVREDTLNKLKILASADFSGDGHQEILVGLAETEFAIYDGKLNQLNKISLSDDYWYEPIVTSTIQPFIVISAGNVLDVYDSKLNFVKKFEAEGALSPMHVSAATFLGEDPNAPFAAVYIGRGGWDTSVLYVFSSTGKLVYKEILKGSFQSITSVPEGDKMEFLLGGRDEIFRYSFKL
jgi:hypothetical protein